MKILKHRNVIGLKEVLQSQNHIYIVLELVTGGELFDKIVKAKRFSESVARRYFQQLISAMDYCHQSRIAHRDLKPENLLLDAEDNVKISDFGLSALTTSRDGNVQLLMTTCGTPNYVAPEVLSEKGYNGFIADIWSCGVILFVMLAGYLPFEDESIKGLFAKIEKGLFKMPDYFSDGTKNLISKMLTVDPNKRIKMDEIMEDAWFKVGYVKTDSKGIKLGEDEENELSKNAFVSVGGGEKKISKKNKEKEDTEIPKEMLNSNDIEKRNFKCI